MNMRFGKALSYTFIGKTFYVVLGFLINLLMVRLLGAEESGRFFYNITILSFVVLIVGLCLETGITYYVSKHPQNVFIVALATIPVLVIEALVCFVLLPYLHLSEETSIAILFITGNIATAYFAAFFYATNRYGSLNLVQCIVYFSLLLFLLYCRENIVYIIAIKLAYAAAFFVQAIILLLVLLGKKTEIKQVKSVESSFMAQIIKYSLFVLIGNVLFFLVTRIDYYFVDRFCNDLELSNYIQVSKMGQMFVLLPTMMATVVFPYSSANDEAYLIEKVQFLCRVLTGLFIVAALFVLLTGKWLFPWLFGTDFNLMYIAMLLYLPGFFALSILAVAAAYLAGKKRVVNNLIGSIIALVLVIVLDICLIPVLGINGAAIASSIAYSAATIYTLYIFKTAFNCSITDFFVINKTDFQVFKRLTGKTD